MIEAEKLERFLTKQLESSLLPVQKGNTTSIGRYIVVESKKGFYVRKINSNQNIACLGTKLGAFAFAKCLNKNTCNKKKILDLDKEFSKHYNDCMHYKYIIERTDNSITRHTLQTRYDISYQIISTVRQKLETLLM